MLGIDHVLYINLDHRKDRLEYMSRSSMPYKIFRNVY